VQGGTCQFGAIAVAVALLGVYFFRLEKYVGFHHEMSAAAAVVKQCLAPTYRQATILLFSSSWPSSTRVSGFGADAQANTDVSSRLAIDLLRHSHSVLPPAAMGASGIAAVLTLLVHVSPSLRAQLPRCRGARRSAVFLQITSWNFVAQG
jgi:hypothetical protein